MDMDSATLPLDLIVYGAIALGLVLWLRNTLGTRHGQERKRPNPFANPPPAGPMAKRGGGSARPETAARGANQQEDGMDLLMDIPAAGAPLVDRITHKGAVVAPEAIRGLEAIEAADARFDVNHFLAGAETAFEMIVKAFAEGDRETLRLLLGKSLFADFDKALINREVRGDVLSTEIIAIRSVTVTQAGLVASAARLTLRFEADETKIIRNKDGVIIHGDPDRIVSAVDLWVFERDVKSKDPTWRVIETLEGDV